jgi:hypothetical protein
MEIKLMDAVVSKRAAFDARSTIRPPTRSIRSWPVDSIMSHLRPGFVYTRVVMGEYDGLIPDLALNVRLAERLYNKISDRFTDVAVAAGLNKVESMIWDERLAGESFHLPRKMQQLGTNIDDLELDVETYTRISVGEEHAIHG